MLLGRGVSIEVKLRNSNERKILRYGKVEFDEHGGLLILDQTGKIIVEFGLDQIEQYTIHLPQFEVNTQVKYIS